MDSQSITPVGSQASGQQVQAYPQASNAAAAATAAAAAAAVAQKAKPVDPPKPPEIDVRTRDPRSLQYQVDGSTKQVVATIVDDSNKTVVLQIPDAEILRIAAAIDRMKGFLLEGKA